ncbi:MAG: long-chain fatty acid--CoA ligase, partial [Bradymonadaceae bacterium]
MDVPITARIIDAIESWDPLRDPLRWPDERFDALALEVFAHQYASIEAYRTFCEHQGASPATVHHYRDIPPIPTDAFKFVRFAARHPIVRTFRTSGTTLDERGEHHFSTLDVYRASLHPTFVRFLNPEQERLRMLIIAPPAEDMLESSLSFMLSELIERWGDAGSRFFVRAREGSWSMNFDALEEALDQAIEDGARTMLLGTAFGFVEFFDSTTRSFALPTGSRLLETGGFKGKSREVSREELYEEFRDRLGIALTHCVSEYSMTELSSQAYSDSLSRKSAEQVRLRLPPWARVEIVDPLSLRVLDEPGKRGLIRWYDLANVDSILGIQTSDIGIADADGGFILLGRAPEAELR